MNDRLQDLLAGARYEAAPMPQTKLKSSERQSKKHKIPAAKKILSKISTKKKKVVREVNVATKEEERAVFMKAFYTNVESLQTHIASIQSATKSIREMTNELATTLSSQTEKQIDGKACTTVNETNRIAQKVRCKLRLLQDETKALRNQTTVLVEGDFRVREGLVTAVTRQFIDELRLYQTAQQNFKLLLTNRFKRQIKAVNPTLTEEDVETLIRRGEDREELVQEMILATPGKVNQRIQKMRETVTDKQEAVYQLEQSVAVVHRMFLEMALLTEEQGIQIDQIEHNVRQAGDYQEQGNEELYEAYQTSKKIRKKKLMLIVIVGVVTLIVVLAL